MPKIRQNSAAGNKKTPRARLFDRPPLAHLYEDDHHVRYFETYDVLFPIVADMPAFMQDAIGDIVATLQQRREVVR